MPGEPAARAAVGAFAAKHIATIIQNNTEGLAAAKRTGRAEHEGLVKNRFRFAAGPVRANASQKRLTALVSSFNYVSMT